MKVIKNVLTQQVKIRLRALARRSQIEAKRSEGGAHGKTMGDDRGSIWQSRSKPFVSFLPVGLIIVPLFLLCLAACASRSDSSTSPALISLQTIDRNGFSETISSKDRVQRFSEIDFLAEQPYKKVLRLYGRDKNGKSCSKITSYHPNGHIWQYLEIVEGRAHGAYKEWHPNGVLKIEANVIEGLGDVTEAAQMSWLFEGQSTVYDEQGSLEAVFHYVKGMLEGTAVYYSPNGKVAKSIPYVQDNIEGDALIYDTQGRLLEKISFSQGNKHGIAEGRGINGSWSYREKYDQGSLKHGIYTSSLFTSLPGVVDGEGHQVIFKEGDLFSIVEIHKGALEGAIRMFYSDGALKTLYTMHEDKKHGAEWEYYATAKVRDPLAIPKQPKMMVFWHEDILQGLAKTWYDNGVVESEREMNQNALHGLSSAYYRDGSLMLMEEYQNGQLMKGSYYKKGDKRPISTVEEGKGVATLHHAEGYFLRKTNYEKGLPVLHE